MGKRNRKMVRGEGAEHASVPGHVADPGTSPTDASTPGPDDSTGRPDTRPNLSRRARRWLWAAGTVLVLLSAAGAFVGWELTASTLQARYFTGLADEFTYDVGAGPADDIRLPGAGPYDVRFGYHRIPEIVEGLRARGFVVEAQARQSAALRDWMDRGLFAIYQEKSQAGLDLLDPSGAELSRARHPSGAYPTFESIPPLVWRTLLLVENRTLLDPSHATRNPAIEWRRLAGAGMDYVARALGSDRQVSGGSTLATQIEKFRHSPGGRTEDATDKLVQMMSASARAYVDGPSTLDARRRIVRDYLNSIPFAGIAGRGEISGLGDALDAWFAADFAEVNGLLRAVDTGIRDEETLERAALAYRQVTMLILAVQRPSFFLVGRGGREALEDRTRRYLGLLAQTGVITADFRDRVLAAEVQIRTSAPPPMAGSFVERKAPDAVRAQLLAMTGFASLYDVDRLDLAATATFHKAAQDSITAILTSLRDPEYVARQGLRSFRLLDRGDPGRVHYAFVLHERVEGGHAVRVRADTFDGPFRVTAGGKLELGSTAKLRTLVSYAEAVEGLYHELGGADADSLRALSTGPDDRLTSWAVSWLAANPGASLEGMLDAALSRTYSASPAERFFTGGGVHTFVNFDRVHDGRSFTVRQAFEQSVNLPFIRIMRDVVAYHMHRLPGTPGTILSNRDDPRRQEYLARFADQEGRTFLGQFFARYQGRSTWEALGLIAEGRSLTPTRLSWTFRSVLPDADLEAFRTFLHDQSNPLEVSEARIVELYRRADPTGVSLVDRAYLAGVHPLELWLVGYLSTRPEAPRSEVMEASRDVRQEVYGWLFSTRRTAAQDQRIRSILEAEAFGEIHRSWRRVGYPFESLIPSYATSIGSSADRPDALADLVGILISDGLRHRTHMLSEVRLAVGTPFETRLRRVPQAGERVLSAEVARAVRGVMVDVVEQGTAVRARGAVRHADGTPIVIGGKTGTGNNRHRLYGAGGRLLEDRALNRTSTLAFFVGDRFYGSITAFVEGPTADEYGFTSSLPSQILRMVGPLLSDLVGSVTQ